MQYANTIKLGFTLFFGGCLFGSSQAQKFKLSDMNNARFRAKAAQIKSFTPDGKLLLNPKTHLDSKTWWINTQNPATKSDSISTLFNSAWFNGSWVLGDTARGKEYIPFSQFEFSQNSKFLILKFDPISIYRHSANYKVKVFDLENKKAYSIPGRIMYPTLSPDNENVAYVRDRNIYVFNLKNSKEYAVTNDGKHNEIINGAVDWVYEEEFSMSQGFEWSPSGKFIAYYRFDESKVSEFSMDIYDGLYPKKEQWKYPKAGEANSKVEVIVFNVYSGLGLKPTDKSMNNIALQRVPLYPDDASDKDFDVYIPRFKWSNSDEVLSIQRLNRHQNHWELLFYYPWGGSSLRSPMETPSGAGSSSGAGINSPINKAKNSKKSAKTMAQNVDYTPMVGQLKLILSEKDDRYVEINDNLQFLPNGTEFLYTSEKSGFNHIYIYNFVEKKERAVTQGNWQVNSILGYNSDSKRLFYTSTEASTIEDHIYSIDLLGKNKIEILRSKTNAPASELTGNESAFASPNCHWIYITQSDFATRPKYAWYLWSDGYFEQHIDETFSMNMAEMSPGKIEFGTLDRKTGNGTESVKLNYWMLKPANFDPSKKYPLLMYEYGGPGNSICRNSYNRYYVWFQHLASLGYVVACVDNRGTGNQGAEFKKCTYLKLGELEQLDQRFAAEYFGKLPYIDKSRIGIWGWSFGGYLSSLCLTKSPDVFKMAIAVAPVTHWKFYDNIYTERYLRTPKENPEGYENNSPLNFTQNIKGNYLIVHGTADDNVHFQNAAEMVNSLIRNGVNYDSEYYPNRNHGIGDQAARVHLFNKLTDYIQKNL